MRDIDLKAQTERILLHQLDGYWPDYDREAIADQILPALALMEKNYSAMPSARFWRDGEMVFSPWYSVTWMIFLYRLSHLLSENGNAHEADVFYYLNKIMHSIDWFYQVDLPVHFMAEHPLGSVLGRARYSDYLFIYQGTTVGGNRKGNSIDYPTLGSNVVMYANSTVLGDSVIGNNVIISADTFIINGRIPDNCIVFGKSPDLIIKKKTPDEIRDMTSAFWKW